MSIKMPIFILNGVFNMQSFTSCDNSSEEPLSLQLHSPSQYPRKSYSYHKDLIGLENDQDYYCTPFSASLRYFVLRDARTIDIVIWRNASDGNDQESE
jgi:hypothetical protein